MDDELAKPSREVTARFTRACVDALHAAADLGRQDLYDQVLEILRRIEATAISS